MQEARSGSVPWGQRGLWIHCDPTRPTLRPGLSPFVTRIWVPALNAQALCLVSVKMPIVLAPWRESIFSAPVPVLLYLPVTARRSGSWHSPTLAACLSAFSNCMVPRAGQFLSHNSVTRSWLPPAQYPQEHQFCAS